MTQSCRDQIVAFWGNDSIPVGAHAGLLLNRYLPIPVKVNSHPDARKKLHHAVQQSSSRCLELYSIAFQRFTQSFEDTQTSGDFRTRGRMIIGLGGENVLETGISLHHTYGTPFIPGSALKGLAWHYCHQVWGSQESKFKEGGEYHTAIFGTTEDAGHFTFHDGLILPDTLTSSIRPDVMTPHHGDYYQSKGFPTDFDDPNPVTFLSVSGAFFIAVTCDLQDETGKAWEKLVFELLSEALSTWGIGGKISSGYGRLDRINVITDEAVSEGRQDVDPNPLQHYNQGDLVWVTRCDNEKVRRRGKIRIRMPYRADDGRIGFVERGNPEIVAVGERTRMRVIRYEGNDQRYFFEVPEGGT